MVVFRVPVVVTVISACHYAHEVSSSELLFDDIKPARK